MRLNVLVPVFAVVATTGCLHPEPIPYRVAMGMSEAQLKAAVGEPTSVETDAAGSTLRYEIWRTNWRGLPTVLQHWHVHLTNGRVDGYAQDRTERPAKAPKPVS